MKENFDELDEISFGKKLGNVEYIDRPGVYGIAIDDEGKVAVIKTPGGYFLPGGGMEEGENHRQCLQREFLEETGYEIKIIKYVGRASLYHISKTNQYIYGTGYFYTVKLESWTNNKTEDDHELIWLDGTQCIESLFLEHQSWAAAKALKANEKQFL